MDRGAPRQLTATPEDESSVRISGDRLVFLRGTGSATRAVLYDLTTDTETVLSSAETTKVDIAGTFVVWDQLVGGTHFDVFVRDLSSGITTNLGAPGTDEASPDIRGGRILYIANDSGQWLVNMIAYDDTAGAWGAPVTQTPGTTSGAGHITPRLDFVVGAWSDGRSIASSTPGLTDDWDAYYAPFDPTTGFNAFPGDAIHGYDGSVFQRAALNEFPNLSFNQRKQLLFNQVLLGDGYNASCNFQQLTNLKMLNGLGHYRFISRNHQQD